MDAESVVLPICDYVHGRNDDASAFVIGCYSDPGLHAAREIARVPVFGIAESAMATALTRGDRFGVISILPQSIPRHLRQVRAMGVESRLAGDLPVGLGVTELGGEDEVYERMEETGRRLRDECGADVVILGCTGMARFQRPLESSLGLARRRTDPRRRRSRPRRRHRLTGVPPPVKHRRLCGSRARSSPGPFGWGRGHLARVRYRRSSDARRQGSPRSQEGTRPATPRSGRRSARRCGRSARGGGAARRRIPCS